MAVRNHQRISGLRKTLRRLFLSAFVVVSFAAYALHKPSGAASGSFAPGSSDANTQVGQQNALTNQAQPEVSASTPLAQVSSPGQPTQEPLAPTPTNTSAKGAYKDGTYTGSEVDAFYGLVQVQALVKSGKLARVQFLEYPNDRRTSVRINNYAVPVLQQEAIQAQNANVDLITGATLTSEAFSMSLQTALDQAKP